MSWRDRSLPFVHEELNQLTADMNKPNRLVLHVNPETKYRMPQGRPKNGQVFYTSAKTAKYVEPESPGTTIGFSFDEDYLVRHLTTAHSCMT